MQSSKTLSVSLMNISKLKLHMKELSLRTKVEQLLYNREYKKKIIIPHQTCRRGRETI